MSTKIRKAKLAVLLLTILIVSGIAIWLSNNKTYSDTEYRREAGLLAEKQDWGALEKLASRWRNEHPQSSMSHTVLGDILRMRGNFSGAETEYALALERDAGNHQVWAYHGIMSLEQGHFSQAAASCKSSVSINTQHAEGWYCLALAHAELNQTDAASAALSKLTSLNPQLLETAKRIIREHTCKKTGIQLNASLC